MHITGTYAVVFKKERMTKMANLGTNMKTALLKGLEALGDAASNIGTSAKQKLSEMHLANRRDDLRKAIPELAMLLWKQGAQLPEELTSVLAELNDLDEQLAALRPKPEAAPETPAEEAAEEEADTVEEALEDLGDKVENAFEAVEDLVESKVDAAEDYVESKVEAFKKADDND